MKNLKIVLALLVIIIGIYVGMYVISFFKQLKVRQEARVEQLREILK